MKKSIVYTRTGDKGTTSLVGGKRVRKTDIRLEAYGTVDELNAQVGLLIAHLSDTADKIYLQKIQNLLFVVGSELATEAESATPQSKSVVAREMISDLEQEIDRLDNALPPLHAFVMPGGCLAAAQAHVCRTVCRRAERRALALAEQAEVSAELLAYLNRLSDYFFVLSRAINISNHKDEIFWQNSWK